MMRAVRPLVTVPPSPIALCSTGTERAGSGDRRMSSAAAWKILVVDDEPEVVEITRIVLSDFSFDGRPLEILEAGSGQAARAVLAQHDDIALMLVDVVMETEHAGLDLVRHVRTELDNHFVRIVLRTGHPGQAPERQVIRGYDINDYKEKTELTAQKLETVLCTGLRGYRDIMIIEAARAGLTRVIEASAQVHSQQDRHEFASAVLAQLAALVGLQQGALYCTVPKPEAGEGGPIRVTAAIGEFAPDVSRPVEDCLPAPLAASFREACVEKHHVFRESHYVLHFIDRRETESLLIVGEAPRQSELDLHLIRVFCTNVGIAFENLHLHQDLLAAQREMICLLAGAAETRSLETARHVQRVGLLAEFLAREYGLAEPEAEMLRYAAPLHDIGKIAVPDGVLNKPGAHTATEAAVMRTHAERGAELLAPSQLPLLKLAAEVAWTHHENWDGSGYPRGLAGESIPVSGRITALADVYDALGSRRCYKDPWDSGTIREHLVAERGRKFEPRLVDVLLERWDAAEEIRRSLPD
jgi:putative nucleotidyltransferase with HDIG domain